MSFTLIMPYALEIIVIMSCIFLFAAFVHGSIGFGFPMLSTPLLALVMDIQSAIILTLIPNLFVNLISMGSEGNIWNAFRRYLPLALLAMLGSAIGTFILLLTHSEWFKLLLAAAIVLYLFADKIKLNLTWVRKRSVLAESTFGIGAGILGGLTNVMAPVLIIYSLETRKTKAELIQLSNFCFMLGKAIQLLLFSIYGKFTHSELELAPFMLIFVALALFLGIQIRRKIPEQTFVRIMRGLLVILAGLLILQTTIRL